MVKEGRGTGVGVRECFAVTMRRARTTMVGGARRMHSRGSWSGGDCRGCQGARLHKAFSHGKEFGASPHYNRVLLFLMILASSK